MSFPYSSFIAPLINSIVKVVGLCCTLESLYLRFGASCKGLLKSGEALSAASGKYSLPMLISAILKRSANSLVNILFVLTAGVCI